MEYSNLQKVKHDLIRSYLNGWIPKLCLGGFKRILFVDTHAGRGSYLNGELGSPLVAVKTLLDHQFRDRILAGGEVVFNFIERDEANLNCLNEELGQLAPLPEKVRVHTEAGDCFELIDNAIDSLEQSKKKMAPGFVFCDPYGFTVPGKLLHRLMKHKGVELFVNVIWRELDMAMAQGRKGTISNGMRDRLDSIFDGRDWQTAVDGETADERAEQCASLFRDVVGAQWATYISMIDHGRTRYFLLHLSNHDSGRDLMKECIWKSCPDGGYYARKCDDHRQPVLIEPEPDLRDVESWVMAQLHEKPRHWQELHALVREELWLVKHVNQVVRSLRKNNEIEAVKSSYNGSCVPKSNPLLRMIGTKGSNEIKNRVD